MISDNTQMGQSREVLRYNLYWNNDIFYEDPSNTKEQPQKVFTEYKKPIDFANEFVFSFARFRYLSLFILRISISFLKICRVLTFKKNTVLTIFNGSSFIYLATDSSLNFTDCISIRSGLMACDRIVLNSQVTNNFSSFNVSLNLDNAYFRTKGCIVAKWYIRP